jgi:Family of unknown function (DUF5906)
MTSVPSDYELDNIKEEALRRTLNAVKARMRAARAMGGHDAVLIETRKGATELALYSYDPGFNDAIASLTATACHVEGLPPDEVVSAIDAALMERGVNADTPVKGVGIEDFFAHMPTAKYIFGPTGELWPKSSVNAYIPPVVEMIADEEKQIPASSWLDRNQRVEQMTWVPGMPPLVANQLTTNGGWINRDGVCCFNLYRPPVRLVGDAAKAGRWVDHVKKVYGDDADHLIRWFAHRVQRPHEKINHAIVLGGLQGIGKDTLIDPVKSAIGPWNFGDVSPQQIIGRFNGFLKSVILRISEARDLGDMDRFAFYDHTKALITAPPDVLRIDEKFVAEYYIPNVVGIAITTNHKADGIFLPADDRRHFVAWSELGKDDFDADYFPGLWRWYDRENGRGHVAAYLLRLDLSSFDPKAPPPKTPAFWDIVQASRVPEDAEMQDALDRLPPSTKVVTIDDIKSVVATTNGEFLAWLNNRGNSRKIPHRFEACGYTPVRNPAADDGLWKVTGRRQAIYGLTAMPDVDRLQAARKRAGW